LQDTCPAAAVFARNAINVLAGATSFDDISSMAPEQRGKLMDQTYVLEKQITRVKESLRNLVKRKGSVDVGDGFHYTLKTTRLRSIDSTRARKLLLKRIGEEAIERIAVLPYSEVLAAYAAKAARGKKQVARDQLAAELEDRGLVHIEEQERMWRAPMGESKMGGT
jgi:hypothetical protein